MIERVAKEFAASLPSHKSSFHLTHNQHLAYYQTVEEYLADCGAHADQWGDAAERAEAIATNEMWELQWYPDTPIGSYTIYAASLPALMVAVTKAFPETPDAA